MKTFKKVFAFMLAAIMVLAMTVTAFAEGEPVITIQNATVGKTYTAYKIFESERIKGSTAEDKSGIVYQLTSASAAYGLLTGDNKPGENDGVTITSTTVSGTYNVAVTNATAFAKYLQKNQGLLSGYSDSSSKVEDGQTTAKITVTNGFGYYYVNTATGTVASLTTVEGNINVYDKNEEQVIEKTTTADESVEVGQNIPYIIKGKVPTTDGYETYSYVISDTMDTGLTFNKDTVTVKWFEDGASTTDVDSAAYELTKTDDGFTLSMNMKALQDNVNKEFAVEYSATVNIDAVKVNHVTNSATLEYSNDPTSKDSTKTQPAETVKNYTATINISKFDQDNKETLLSGATFVLKDGNGTDAKFYKKDVDGTVTWVTEQSEATSVMTKEDGSASFEGLAEGTYYLVETEAPTGYNLMSDSKAVEVTGTISDEEEATPITISVDVPNKTGSLLPSTGGIGTTIFYVVGGLLVAGAGILLVTRKRMSRV